ncbi:zinc-dependent alcohol dehydrogenase family protein [Halomonas eurihalina]|uniref:Zinc-dependent alcohol dehydrogenase family protein n=1 Tax=Halomonas eurihalina TaxID=42566 RepID=A0A5D9DDD7_HALER|nr:zinc-dependent alcohol dehydrogenase family protein [Halomonas eurihalina]MDR5858605.1 zinc-dependent alcohol dehydrogenase family protein [Halomonas eurihalina]TZG40791.1 zinc-dependent alcohol dehydrogenase family protein [Halomonas eurihalina]
MKALVYEGVGQRAWIDRPKPEIEVPTDAVVRITHTTICGTDLHILKGDVPAVESGRTLGHEGIGVIEEIGEGVSNLKKGDQVLISCITSCGRCDYCKQAMYSHCRDGGWILGHLIDGTQAEYVRIPHADNSLYRLPPGLEPAAALMLSDILPTGHEIGALNGEVHLGDTIAIIGAGPIGLAALLTSRFYSPARIIVVDPDENRLAVARQFGATDTIAVDPVETVLEMTGGEGVDVAMEAVGIPETFDVCQRILRPGGRLANMGVHGHSVEFHLEDLWIKNVTIRTGLVNTNTIPVLMRFLESGGIDAEGLVTHRFALDDIEQAYDVFSRAASEKAIKMLLTAE